ncbi:Dynein intermediate chain [Nesidiocoris tenuis]|uniref:Dynein intermediate chain n=1 Tax=Nesidiocoris tenuis TaxID=355587 RepID=A0ABN7AGM9_9HEMI|nr:Dynein intermediate chain [Nesidiocoris tenuis]
MGESVIPEAPKLSKEELDEQIRRVLMPCDPTVDQTLVEFDFRSCTYVEKMPAPGILELFNLESNVSYEGDLSFDLPEPAGPLADIEEEDGDGKNERESEDGSGEERGEDAEASDRDGDTDHSEGATVGGDRSEEDGVGGEGGGGAEDGDEGEQEDDDPKPAAKNVKVTRKKLANQFNYSDRGALTYKVISRDESTQTAPPPSSSLKEQLYQWVIFDDYQRDYANIVAAREKERKEKQILARHDAASAAAADRAAERANSQDGGSQESRLFHAVKIMERMVTQNTFEDIAFDNVLAYKTKGIVCIYTLKNPSHPEYRFKFKTGAQTVDIHNKEPYFIAIGLYNGMVAVANIKKGHRTVRLESDLNRKHTGTVWEVRWCDDPRDRQLGFYSAGSDGKIFKWLIQGQELSMIPVITLSLEHEMTLGTTMNNLNANAQCIAFEPNNYEIFLVGTAEGLIYKCSISYSCSYLYVYKAHDLPVYRLSYNPYIPDIFASCSSDWRIKIWENCKPEPLYVFDLYCSVMDVQWAPYSSTVLAATTSEGKINLFDLNVNKNQPICVQTITYPENSYTTRLRFNNKLPVLIVGDSVGYLVSLKVSPNCRIPTKATKKNIFIEPRQLEIMKLERVLSFVREPTALTSLEINKGQNQEKN